MPRVRQLTEPIYSEEYLPRIEMFTHLKLCLATAIHNFQSVKITYIYLFWNQTFANLDF